MARITKRDIKFTATGASFTVPVDCTGLVLKMTGTFTSLVAQFDGVTTDTATEITADSMYRISGGVAMGRDIVLAGTGITDVQVLIQEK